jgi:hypothetical protein
MIETSDHKCVAKSLELVIGDTEGMCNFMNLRPEILPHFSTVTSDTSNDVQSNTAYPKYSFFLEFKYRS